METIEIKDWLTKETIHYLIGEDITIKDVVQDAVKKNISLKRADLTKSDLCWANLIQANLTRADLTDSDLRGSILIDTDFTDSILDSIEVDEYTMINQNTYNTIPDKYKYKFKFCAFVD